MPGGNIIIRNAFEQNVSYNYGYQTLPAEVQAKRIGAEYPLMSKAGFSSTAHSDSCLLYTSPRLWQARDARSGSSARRCCSSA